MELAVDQLQIGAALSPIPVNWYAYDHYKIVHVHDCAGRNPAWICKEVRRGLRDFHNVYEDLYPELLAHHHFVGLGLRDLIGLNIGAFVSPVRRGPTDYRIGRFKATRKREELAKEIFPKSDGVSEILRRPIPTEFGGKADLVTTAHTVLLSSVQVNVANDEGQKEDDAEQGQGQSQEPDRGQNQPQGTDQGQDQPQGPNQGQDQPEGNPGPVLRRKQPSRSLRSFLRRPRRAQSEDHQRLLEDVSEERNSSPTDADTQESL